MCFKGFWDRQAILLEHLLDISLWDHDSLSSFFSIRSFIITLPVDSLPMEHQGEALCAFGCAGSNEFSACEPSLKAEGLLPSPKP